MSERSGDPIGEAAAHVSRAAVAASRRVLNAPDGLLGLALVLGFVSLLEVALYTDDEGPAMIANLIATLPLAILRRQTAVATVTIAFGVLVAVSSDGTLTISGLLALVIALYVFSARYRRRWSALVALPFLVNAITPYDGSDPSFPGVLLLLVVLGAQALGDSQRERGRAIAERDETRRAMADTLSDQAAMGERARIARDLHDVVAHHVSAIAVQAETARLTTADLPEEGKQHFEAIGQTARDALSEMRRLLGVLRADADGEPQRAPQPGLAQLGELVDTARAAGTTVSVTLSGEATPLPPGVDLCAYRILQEALTNARRHAPGADVEVEIAYTPGSVRLAVRDHGDGPPAGEVDGHGLLGMRERAIMVGGTLTVGPAEGGGFCVEAKLPVPESA